MFGVLTVFGEGALCGYGVISTAPERLGCPAICPVRTCCMRYLSATSSPGRCYGTPARRDGAGDGRRDQCAATGSSIGPGAEAPRKGGDHHRRRDEV